MRKIFDENGNRIPVTLISAGPCVVTQIKTKEKDGYDAIQMGFLPKLKHIKKTEKGKEFKCLREYKAQDTKYKIQDIIDASVFQEGDSVKVSGISKGKGFAGVVKRWGFHGRPSTHGTKHEERTPGSVGSSALARVEKGRKLAGRMGAARISVNNLKIVKVDKENSLVAVRGGVPGRRGALLEIKG